MSFVESMKKRYTTKMYDPTQKINPEKIEDLKEILRLSPSSINSQPWRFTFVNSEEMKNKLAEVSNYNDPKIKNCDTVVVFQQINSIAAFEKQISETLPQRGIDYYNANLKPLGEDQIKAWFGRQLYLALGVFLSACADMEIDSTPMEGINTEEYDDILDSGDYKTLVAVAIGYRDKNDANQTKTNPKKRRPGEIVIKTI